MASSIIRRIKIHSYAFLFFVLFYLLFPPVLLIFLPVYLFRFLVKIAGKFLRPDLGKMVTTRSAVIATDDPTKANPNWNLCVWITLEGSLDFETFRQNFLQNIVRKRDQKEDLVYPEYQQYFTKWLGFLFWKWEENFDISDHIKKYHEQGESEITTEVELSNIIKTLTYTPFKEGKSPWEFLLIQNFLGAEKCVLIFRVHHGFCDGFSILHLLLKEVNNVPLDLIAKPKSRKETFLQKVGKALTFFIRAPYDFMELMVRSKDTNDWHPQKMELQKPFNLSITKVIPLSYVKSIKNRWNVSFTSVIMAALTAGLRKSIMENGKNVPKRMTTAVAVPIPKHPEKLRNHFIFSFMSLPIGNPDSLQRLLKLERNYQKLKASPVTPFSFMMIPVFGGLFTGLIDLFNTNRFSTVLTSNFPGPSEGRFIGGGGNNRVLDMNFSAGLGVGNVGIGFFMMSFAQGMRIITSVDKSILPNGDAVRKLNESVLEELDILQGLGGFVTQV